MVAEVFQLDLVMKEVVQVVDKKIAQVNPQLLKEMLEDLQYQKVIMVELGLLLVMHPYQVEVELVVVEQPQLVLTDLQELVEPEHLTT